MSAMLTVVQKYRGHVEFTEGHVHHLPLSATWNVVCYACMAAHPGDIQFGPGRLSACTRRDGIARLEHHVAECSNSAVA